MSNIDNPEYLDNEDPEKNLNYWRQDERGMVTNHNGVADRLFSVNDKLYKSMKGDWTRSDWSKSKNIKTTTGRDGGNFYITREQTNTDAIIDAVKQYRHWAEMGVPDPLAPIGDDGKLTYKWMDLPKVVAIRISDEYFGGTPWAAIKNDRTLKAQFYKVVQQEYPQYVCYPGGKLPIPVNVPYPTKVGQQRFFQGHS
jgi:hypothetical protein